MNAEIIAVGSEMLTPERLDTNSLFLTAELNNLGIEVSAKHVVGDDRERLASEVRRAASSARFVIVSGGLGPTEDDVTRDAVAAALDRRQIFHAEIAEAIEARFRRMNRPMPEINKRQAMIVDGDSVVIILPGPPHELKSMFQQQCAPRLERIVPAMAIRTLVLRISGMSESDLDQTISPIYKRYENPVTTVLAHNGDLQVHLRARCESEGDAVNLLNEIGVQIEAALGDKIYSRNADPLEAVVGRKLLEQHATLATAESATGGGLADRISSIPGSSAYFLGGFVTYTARMKTDLLGVPEDLLKQFGPVSAETAEAMATGARRRTSATWAISITGNAGPTTDGDQAPVGSIYVGIAGPREVTVAHRIWPASDRPRVRAFAAQTALDLLNRKLV